MKVDPTAHPNVTSLARAIVLLAEGATEPPTEIQLFASGVCETTKGLFKVDDQSCESAARCYADLGRKLHFDYEHASVMAMFAPDPAEAGKAAGQFDVQCRDGAIWAANIRWTPKAREKILAREFLYTSPTFRYDEEGRVLEILSCALTNDPAIKGREPLMASRVEPTKEQSMKTILARLGLADTASEAEALVALSRLQEQIASVLALSGKPNVAEAIGVMTGWKAGAEQANALSAKLAEAEQAQLAREIDQAIDEAKKDGRLPPASEKAAREVAKSGIASLKAMLSVLPKQGAPRREPAKEEGEGDGTVTLTAEDLEGCKKVGINPKKYAEHKAASLARKTAAA